MRRHLIQSIHSVCAVAIAVTLLGTTPVAAQFWNGSVDNDWHTGANWDGGVVPAFGDNAAIASNVNTSTIADITNNNVESDGMFVGLEVNGVVVDGTVNHSAFTGDFTNGMVIGRGGATGTYNQSGLTTDPNGASVVNTGFVAVGTEDGGAATPAGTGFYNLSGDAQLNANGFVIMGELFGANGTITLNDNAVLNANFDNGGAGDVSLIVGREGTGGLFPSVVDEGTLNIHDNATVNAADRIHVGDFFGAKGTVNQDGNSVVNSKTVWLGAFDAGGEGTEGTYNLSGTAQLTTNTIIAGRDGGKGTFTAKDSTVVNVGDVTVGDFNGGNGTLSVEGSATFNAGGITVGNSNAAIGVLNQSGTNSTVSATWMSVGNASDSNGTYNMNGGTLNVSNELAVGRQDDSTGTFNQTAGDVNVGGWMKIGGHGHGDPEMPDPNAVGTYNISGGSLNVEREMQVGGHGTGTLTQDGGDVTAGQWLSVAQSPGSTGTYNLNAGTLRVGVNSVLVPDGEDLNVGDNGNGTMTQAAGTSVTVSRDFNIGKQAGSVGTYTQNGGDITVDAWMAVGRFAGSQGTYNMNSGNLTVNGRLIMGAESTLADGPAQGTFNLINGNIVVQQRVDGSGPIAGQEGVLVVGRTGAGTMNQSGGTITSDWVDVGGDPGVADDVNGGTYNMTGGTLTTTSTGPGLRLGVGTDPGSGSSFSISNNATINSAGSLDVGVNGNASLLIFGSNVTAAFGGDMNMSTGTGTGVIGWGSDANGVSAVQVGGDVDVSDGVLQALFVTDVFTGIPLPTSPITAPHDLLLVDNQGTNHVTGQLNFDQDFDGVGDQLLAQGNLLVDPLGVLGGIPYYISYFGTTGLDNDIYLTLAPVPSADFDSDGDVDGSDFLTWQKNLGTGTTFAQGDANGDNMVDAADLAFWRGQYGYSAALAAVNAATNVVPEPATWVLMAPVVMFLMRRKRQDFLS